MRGLRKSGFTLLELMAVSTVVSAVSLTAYQAVKKGKESQCLNNLKQTYHALNMFEMDHSGLPSAKFFPASRGDPRGLPGVLAEYGMTGEIFLCPSLPSELNSIGINYIWNDSVNGKSTASLGAAVWLMTEMTAVSERIPPPHMAGYGILYSDGHAAVGPRVSLPTARPTKPEVEAAKPPPPAEEPAPARLDSLEIGLPAQVKPGEKTRIDISLFDKNKKLFSLEKGGNLTLTTSDPAASIPAAVEVPAGSSGHLTVEGVFNSPGQHWVRVRENTYGVEKRQDFQVLAGGFEQFLFKGMPASFTAGVPAKIQIVAADAAGTRVAFSDKATLCDLSGTVSPGEIALGNGLWEGAVMFTRVQEGNRLFASRDYRIGSVPVSVLPAPPDKIKIVFPHAEIVAGQETTGEIMVTDIFGNICSGFEGEVQLGMPGEKGEVSEKITLTGPDAGRKKIPVTLFSAGKQKLRLSSQTLSAEEEVTVKPGPLDHFSLEQIKNQVAGTPFTIFVKAEDKWGNRIKGFYLKDPEGRVRYVQEDFSSGMWMESVVITKAGKTNWIELDDGYGHTGKSNIFEVAPAEPERVTIQGLPETALVNVTYPFQIFVQDKYGNNIPDYQGSFTAVCTAADSRLEMPAQAGLPLKLSVTFASYGRVSLEIRDQARPALSLKYTVLVVPPETGGPPKE